MSLNSFPDLCDVLPSHSSHSVDPLRVQIVKAHLNSIAVAYPHFVACFKQKDTVGFSLAFTRYCLSLMLSSYISLNEMVASLACRSECLSKKQMPIYIFYEPILLRVSKHAQKENCRKNGMVLVLVWF